MMVSDEIITTSPNRRDFISVFLMSLLCSHGPAGGSLKRVGEAGEDVHLQSEAAALCSLETAFGH